MPKVYSTIQGDMWDWIAFKVYGREGCMSELMKANEEYREIAVFPAGVKLACPDIPAESSRILPPWRR